MSKYHFPRCLQILTVTVLLLATLLLPAAAADREIVYNDIYCFSCVDFAAEDASAAPRGILLTAVPEPSVGVLRCGGRLLRAGDALSASALEQMQFVPTCAGDITAELRWIPVFSSYPAPEASMLIEIGNGKNLPPTMENSTLETYRNIPIDGQLTFSDPDDAELRFTVTTQPRRGSVSVNRDGSYVYTPEKNKVGKDSFTVQAVDSGGNTAEATVNVTIIKPTDKTAFADLADDMDQYVAMWLREQGVYAGQTLSGTLLFQPEQTVSRGEFLVMAMHLLDIDPAEEPLRTGFADEAQTPAWMQPYLAAALRAGFITGIQSPEGLCFRPDAAITQAEAAVMLRNMLGLSGTGAVSVFQSDELPAWAVDAVTCLSSHGIQGLSELSEPMTMRQTARLLRQVYTLWSSDQPSLLAWAADA